MSPRRRAGDRGDGNRSFAIGLAITLILPLGLDTTFTYLVTGEVASNVCEELTTVVEKRQTAIIC
ncbi:MAG: hypothetical protein QW341_03820 [Candidatus Bathyarchaeia archaeon]